MYHGYSRAYETDCQCIFVPDGKNILIIFFSSELFHGILFHNHYNYATCMENLPVYVDEYNFLENLLGMDHIKFRIRTCGIHFHVATLDWVNVSPTTSGG